MASSFPRGADGVTESNTGKYLFLFRGERGVGRGAGEAGVLGREIWGERGEENWQKQWGLGREICGERFGERRTGKNNGVWGENEKAVENFF